MTFAVVPACGQSSRMGRPKLLLPVGSRTVIETVVSTLREGGVEHVLVVVGPHIPELAPLAKSSGAEVLSLPARTTDMRETVASGLTWIEKRHDPRADDWWLLAPADSFAFMSADVRLLLAATDSSCSVIVPVFAGRRGHPTLLRWQHAAGIRALPAGEGINMYLWKFTAETLELPIGHSGVLDDLDTPTDYAKYVK